MVMVDVLIKNGHVIDPYQGIDEIRDIAVVHGRTAVLPQGDFKAARTVNAEGCCVTPGFIDTHAHFFYKNHFLGFHPDFLPPTGVTSAVDGGSAGWVNFPAFYRDILTDSLVNTKAYLCFNRYGVCNEPERYDPVRADEGKLTDIVEQYRDRIIGLKIRMPAECESTLQQLEACVRLADKLKIGVSCHVQGSLVPMTEIARTLRKGDVFLHMYHGTNETILDEQGTVWPELYEAQKRGVIFEMSCGECNMFFRVARKALDQGFLPDMLSTDNTLHKINQNQCVRSLPYVMSKMLQMGLSLYKVIDGVTRVPAEIMGQVGEVGTLAPGASADVAIFKVEDCPHIQMDSEGKYLRVEKIISPRMTLRRGEFVWAREDFNLFT